MNKNLVSIAIVFVIIITMIVLGQNYQDIYRSATPDFRNLYAAIFAGGIGVFIHFFKNHSLVKGKKNAEMMFESFELLILIFIPAAVSFNILQEYFPNDPQPVLIVSIAAIFCWYMVTLYRTSRPGDEEPGKPTFAISTAMYFLLMLPIGFVVWLILIF